MNQVLPKLINPYQTGFLPHRLISDNGWLNQLLMSHLRVVAPDLPQVAVLLDQEKAYDWVHPEYLCRVLLQFGFPGDLSLTTVVREYLVSFRPGVAWSTLCLSRKFGGVGLVDIADQSLALHLVYLQRLLRPPSPNDFVSSWLVYAFEVYTGHKSILPWFSFPGLYQSRVSSMPILKHLGKLLLRLPKLVPSSGWSAQWYLDLSLCSVLNTLPSVCPPRDPSSLDPRFVVSDLSFWQPDLGIVDTVTSHLARSSRVLRPVFLALNRDRGPVSLVSRFL
ncbi:uncharacterized protein ATC70_013002 [Mucor velutinosus]|uniref:Reverse transcriptase domain-containing protein n=1 Tax=Mucor velutinosus TaxID=708070 RepID=A0AAN7DAD2_9FUNG|nr:hypothetical protein ATC70_013002 [Mucor velutinosus]